MWVLMPVRWGEDQVISGCVENKRGWGGWTDGRGDSFAFRLIDRFHIRPSEGPFASAFRAFRG